MTAKDCGPSIDWIFQAMQPGAEVISIVPSNYKVQGSYALTPDKAFAAWMVRELRRLRVIPRSTWPSFEGQPRRRPEESRTGHALDPLAVTGNRV